MSLDIRLARADDRQDLIDLLWRASLSWEVVRQDLLDNPELIVACALQRKESRGLHAIADYPRQRKVARDSSVRPA